MTLTFDPELVEKSLAVLAEQGGPDEIAAFLQQRGLKAKTGCAAACIVAVYLQQEVPGAVFAVCHGDTTANSVGSSEDGWELTVAHPENLESFIGRFDVGDYPALLDDGSP